MALYTSDFNGDFIQRGADFADKEEIERSYGEEWRVQFWTIGEFADCWVKLYQRPELDDEGRTVIDGILCEVQNPGTHPGGNAWWCTPVAPIYVPILTELTIKTGD